MRQEADPLLSLSSRLEVPMSYALYGGEHTYISYSDTQRRIVAGLECSGLRRCTPLSCTLRSRILCQKCGIQDVRMKV